MRILNEIKCIDNIAKYRWQLLHSCHISVPVSSSVITGGRKQKTKAGAKKSTRWCLFPEIAWIGRHQHARSRYVCSNNLLVFRIIALYIIKRIRREKNSLFSICMS